MEIPSNFSPSLSMTVLSSLQHANNGEINLDLVVVVAQLVDLLMDHEAKDTHHSGTAVIELNATLDELDAVIKDVPAEVNEAIAEISGELSSSVDCTMERLQETKISESERIMLKFHMNTTCSNTCNETSSIHREAIMKRTILHDEQLEEANKANDLDETKGGDGIRSEDSGDTVGVGIERVSAEIDVAGKVSSTTGDDLSEEGKLADTAMLELDIAQPLETLLIDVVEHAKRIPEPNLFLRKK